MARTIAWTEFQSKRPTITKLLRLASGLPDVPDRDEMISPQETILRLAMVLLVGHLQAYFEALIEEWADRLTPDWNTLSQVQRFYVLRQMHRRLTLLMTEHQEENLANPPQGGRFGQKVDEIAGWYRSPVTLAASPDRERVQGFFRDLGTGAMVRALHHLRNDVATPSFTGWMAAKNAAYTRFPKALEQLVALRNDAAHGGYAQRVTMPEAQDYRLIVNRLVLLADKYAQGEH